MVKPRFSVICPAFNRSSAIRDTVASVRDQSEVDWELIVVSDGCTDDTEDHVRDLVAADPRVTLHRTGPHGHPSEPRNAGLAAARGEFVAYLDHDDRWRPDHLARLLEAFDDGANVVATGFERRDLQDRTVATTIPLTMHWHPETQLVAPLFEPSRVAHRAGLAERVGGWREGVGLEDWDLWVRLADAGLRFTTLMAPTALLFDDGSTRINRTPRKHLLVLSSFDDVHQARDASLALRAPENADAFRAATQEDLESWYARLIRSGELIRPHGWDGDLDAEIGAVSDAVSESATWPDLVLVPQRGRYVLALALWCGTAGHARRVERLTRDVHTAQFSLAERLIAASARTVLTRKGF
ncbi:glycosyltransferase family 2 protein [Amycolatopsis sp. NBC_00345]|uniref:glycosyltransferase family 2 protein n=1 Tax=Amycolatopsis sp. NBC_00345 TaxID=2975955 RepID=UPI002E27552F